MLSNSTELEDEAVSRHQASGRRPRRCPARMVALGGTEKRSVMEETNIAGRDSGNGAGEAIKQQPRRSNKRGGKRGVTKDI